MKKNKGFTLIELLVVIAIIGILASVVLASLSTARLKAKVAAVQSIMSSLRAQAELGMDQNGKYLKNLCGTENTTTTGGLLNLLNSINSSSTSGKTSKTVPGSLHCSQNAIAGNPPTKWAAEVAINGKWYCSDSKGFSGENGDYSATENSGSRLIASTSSSSATVTCKP